MRFSFSSVLQCCGDDCNMRSLNWLTFADSEVGTRLTCGRKLEWLDLDVVCSCFNVGSSYLLTIALILTCCYAVYSLKEMYIK